MTSKIKNAMLSLFTRALDHEKTQEPLFRKINQIKQKVAPVLNTQSPYGKEINRDEVAATGKNVVFVTSRFRSGSSVFWNVFRSQNSCTAYYEPFNERKWFNPATRGAKVDASHLGISDYWSEYNGLQKLESLYDESWIRENLHMDEQTFAPKMKAYIDTLIDNSKSTAVLQFNRIDFRLGWLKKNYPHARIVHLYRHPRDQWCSFLTDKKLMNANAVFHTYRDAFYLDVWCRDLCKHFPFLSLNESPHPYMRFYYLWKLSYLYGIEYSDISLSFEELTQNPEEVLSRLFNSLEWESPDLDKALSVLEKPSLNKWQSYAESEWFCTIETHCEKMLTDFLTSKQNYES